MRSPFTPRTRTLLTVLFIWMALGFLWHLILFAIARWSPPGLMALWLMPLIFWMVQRPFVVAVLKQGRAAALLEDLRSTPTEPSGAGQLLLRGFFLPVGVVSLIGMLLGVLGGLLLGLNHSPKSTLPGILWDIFTRPVVASKPSYLNSYSEWLILQVPTSSWELALVLVLLPQLAIFVWSALLSWISLRRHLLPYLHWPARHYTVRGKAIYIAGLAAGVLFIYLISAAAAGRMDERLLSISAASLVFAFITAVLCRREWTMIRELHWRRD